MADFRVLHRYATSLLETAIEKNNLEVVTNDIQLLDKTLEQSNQLELMLESPVIRPELKLKILSEIFEKKISKETMKFVEFIVSKKREELLKDIGNRFLELRDEHLGIANVEVTAATEFTSEQKSVLQEKLETMLNKKVRLNFKTEQDLVGGFIAKVGDTLYDASIKHQLELLRKQFLTGDLLLN